MKIEKYAKKGLIGCFIILFIMTSMIISTANAQFILPRPPAPFLMPPVPIWSPIRNAAILIPTLAAPTVVAPTPATTIAPLFLSPLAALSPLINITLNIIPPLPLTATTLPIFGTGLLPIPILGAVTPIVAAPTPVIPGITVTLAVPSPVIAAPAPITPTVTPALPTLTLLMGGVPVPGLATPGGGLTLSALIALGLI